MPWNELFCCDVPNAGEAVDWTEWVDEDLIASMGAVFWMEWVEEDLSAAGEGEVALMVIFFTTRLSLGNEFPSIC